MREQRIQVPMPRPRPIGRGLRAVRRLLAAAVAPPTRWRLLGLAGVTASLAVAAYGQHIITDGGIYGANWPVLPRMDAKLTSFYQAQQSVSFSVPFFFAGMALFALSLLLVGRWQAPASRDPVTGNWPRSRLFWAAFVAGGLAIAGGWTYLLRHMVEYRHERSDVGVFFGVLAAGTLLFAVVDRVRRGGRPPSVRFHLWEVALVVALTGLFMGLTIHDLANWRYSWIGDEGEFLIDARKIIHEPHALNLLGHRGPYGYHPLLPSVFQATVMRFAGEDLFGWKLGSVLIIAATLPAFYALMKMTVGARAAAFGTAIFSFSHYLYAYAHTGYDNIYALLPTVLAFTLFFGGMRTDRMALFFASGAAAGLGFYTFYSARLAVGILAIAFLLMGPKHWRWERILPLVAGFALAVTPIFAAERWEVINASRSESAASGRSFTELVMFLLENTPMAVMAFNFSPFGLHYTYGSLLDELSAPLALLGLAFCATRVRHEGARFLLIWFLVAMIATGIFHPRPSGVASRLHYALPPMAAFAGLALDRIVAAYSSVSARPLVERMLVGTCFLVFMPAVLGFNIHRFWEVTPTRGPGPAQGLIYREATSPACYAAGQRSLVIAEGPESVGGVFDMYGRREDAPLSLRFDDPVLKMVTTINEAPVSCIFLTPPAAPYAQPFVTALLQVPFQRPAEVRYIRDASGATEVLVVDLVP